uniref:Uncharacterized protein n=1 Tax=Salmo trutta TaxID=8032 RepID=A0A673Y564_SALTR
MHKLFRTVLAEKNVDALSSLTSTSGLNQQHVADSSALLEQYRRRGGEFSFLEVRFDTRMTWFSLFIFLSGNLTQFEDFLFGGAEGSGAGSAVSGRRRLCGRVSSLTERCNLVGPKECLLPQGDNTDYIRLVGLCVCERAKESERERECECVRKGVKGEANACNVLPEQDTQVATLCLAEVVPYLELLSDQSNFSSFSLTTLDLSQYMRQDNAAVQALNLFKISVCGCIT